MDISTIIGIREEVINLEPDIAEKIEGNREKVFKIYAGNDFDEGEGKLEELLYQKCHYFDEGFRCGLTPEGLEKAIREEIDRLVEVKKKEPKNVSG